MKAIDRHAYWAGGTRRSGFAAEYPGKPLKNLGETGQVAARPIDYAQRRHVACERRVQPAGTVLISATVHGFCAIGGLRPPYGARICGARA
jgi:hypothetical protein